MASDRYHACKDCGKPVWEDGARCTECHTKNKVGPGSEAWEGGRFLSKGYVMVYAGPRRYEREHVAVAERALGRKLRKGEVVHHVNGDKADNRNCNLLICTNSYHVALHARMATLYMHEHFRQ